MKNPASSLPRRARRAHGLVAELLVATGTSLVATAPVIAAQAPVQAPAQTPGPKPEPGAAASGSTVAPGSTQTPATAAAGQEKRATQEPTRVPEVLITETEVQAQSALEKTPLDNTAGRDVISPREVEEAGTLNLQELLRRTPSLIASEETGSDSLPNVALRGVTGNDGVFRSVNVAMLADGIPLAGGPYGAPGASGFPLLTERVFAVDIQRGGGAVRYGPNNVSGILNFITRPIPTRTTVDTQVRYDSFRDGSIYEAVGGTYDRYGYLLEGVYKAGETFREHGDYTLQNYSAKFRFENSDTLRQFLQAETFDDESDLSDGLSLAQYKADPEQSVSLQNRFAAHQDRFNYKLEWLAAEEAKVELIAYYYETDRTFWLGSPLFYGNNPTYVQATPRPMTTWAIQPQVTQRYTIDTPAGDIGGELLFGIRYEHEDLTRKVVRHFPNGTSTLMSDDEYDYDAASAFLQNDFVFGDWRVTPGVRFESVEIDAENTAGVTVQREFTEVLPAISASWLVRPTWSVFANVQSSFQPPAANQVSVSTTADQDFSAQYAWMYELGTRVQTEGGALAGDLTLYHIDYSDRLEPDPNQANVLINSGRTRHEGVELAVDGDLRALGLPGASAFATAAYNDSEYMDGQFEGNTTTGSPHWMLAWGARYEFTKTGVFVSLDGVYVSESFSDRDNTVPINANGTAGERPSFTLWNAHTGWRHAFGEHWTLKLQVDARNLFDEEYFDVRVARGIYPGAPFGYGGSIGLAYAR